MALVRKVNSITLPAAGDLSASQYCIVYQDTNGRVALNTSAATAPLGILLNKPAAIDRAAEVAIDGSVVKCKASAAIGERARVTQAASGHGLATVTALDEVVGVAISAAAGTGEMFELLVMPSRAGTAVYETV